MTTRLTIVVGPGDGQRETLDALARQELAGAEPELLAAVRWRPGEAAPELAGATVVLDGSPRAAEVVNAALGRARGDAVVIFGAGDVPRRADHVAALLAELESADAVAAGCDADPVREGWIGPRPSRAPAGACRHLAIRRALLAELDGLDDRLADLDVAGVDLLARAASAGARVAARPDLAVASRAPRARRAHAAGGSAQALGLLHADSDLVHVGAAPALATRLRWASPVLRLAAAMPLPDRDRLGRLALRSAFAHGHGRPEVRATPLDRTGLARQAPEDRPPVTVIVPFAGGRDEATAMLDRMAAIELRAGDELLVVDNSPVSVVAERPGVRVVRATREGSSYHARNTGVEAARNDWLLFTDGDCAPVPWVLDAHFSPVPGDRAGAAAGAIHTAPSGGSWVERYSDRMEVLSQTRMLSHPFRPSAATANLLVRRAAWEDVGGFCEGIRSGGDAEFCWRLGIRGWEIEYRPRAVVQHYHRSSVRGLLRQYARYGAGVAWIDRRYPEQAGRWPQITSQTLTLPLRDVASARWEAAAARLTEVACTLAAAAGAVAYSNRPPRRDDRSADAVETVEQWPDRDRREEVDAILARDGVAVEAARRPVRIDRRGMQVPAGFREDDGPRDLAEALVWLVRREGPARLMAGDLIGIAGEAAAERRAAARLGDRAS